MDEAMSIDDSRITSKGMEYAHLLEGMESVPVIEDAVGRVLSPPNNQWKSYHCSGIYYRL